MATPPTPAILTGEIPTTETGTCPICDLPGPQHVTLLHRIADARRPGVILCGCDPDQHDATGPCVLAARHVGICVAHVLADGEPVEQLEQLAQFDCRPDDAEPHPDVT